MNSFLRKDSLSRGFSLIEMLAVMAIIVVIVGLVFLPSVSLLRSGSMTANAYQLKGLLETARAYAIANNTYVWVGFFEESMSQASANPAVAGTGRVVISVVASADGTILYNAASPAALPATHLLQVNKLIRINNFHLVTLSPGTSTGPTLAGRPAVSSSDYQIGDTSPSVASKTPFSYPLGVTSPQYTFTKVIQISPRGESQVDNSTYPLSPVIEIGLEPTNGATVKVNQTNLAALQVSGIAGTVNIFRP